MQTYNMTLSDPAPTHNATPAPPLLWNPSGHVAPPWSVSVPGAIWVAIQGITKGNPQMLLKGTKRLCKPGSCYAGHCARVQGTIFWGGFAARERVSGTQAQPGIRALALSLVDRQGWPRARGQLVTRALRAALALHRGPLVG